MWSPRPAATPPGQAYQWVLGRDLDIPPAEVPAPLRARLEHRSPQRSVGPVELAATGVDLGDRYARAALAEELARVATAPVGQRNRQLWESTRNLYNLVATGALDHREVDQALLDAADRCGLLGDEPRQTRRTLASGRQVGLAHPGRPAQPPSPECTTFRRSRLLERPASEPRRGGDGHAPRRPLGRLNVSRGVGACRRQAEPAPTPPPRRKGARMGSHPTLAQHQLAAEVLELHPDDSIQDHHHQPAERTSEQAFDWLNPTFGVPADHADRIGHRDVAQRERALSLGVRVAVHDSRQNDRNPVIWQPGQDYRMAYAIQAARTQPSRTRRGPERVGPER
jgi:hypothetical protein